MPRLSKASGQTKSVCRFPQGFFSFFGKMEIFLSFLGRFFFLFFTQGFFSGFDFSIRVISVKSFYVGILSSM